MGCGSGLGGSATFMAPFNSGQGTLRHRQSSLVDVLRLGLEGEHDPVAEHVGRERAHVLGHHV